MKAPPRCFARRSWFVWRIFLLSSLSSDRTKLLPVDSGLTDLRPSKATKFTNLVHACVCSNRGTEQFDSILAFCLSGTYQRWDFGETFHFIVISMTGTNVLPLWHLFVRKSIYITDDWLHQPQAGNCEAHTQGWSSYNIKRCRQDLIYVSLINYLLSLSLSLSLFFSLSLSLSLSLPLPLFLSSFPKHQPPTKWQSISRSQQDRLISIKCSPQ